VLRPLVDQWSVAMPLAGAPPESDPALAFLQGIPHEQSLRSMYWRKRSHPPADPDPDRDRCGVIWLCPALPLRGADVDAAFRIAEPILLRHGFEPLLACISQTERTAYFFPMIVYDRDDPGADTRARAAHDALLAELIRLGYLPHRLGLASMDALPAPRDDWSAVLARLKRLFDPADILAVGRYDFRGTWK
jgi:4-cresol dehydrogenase (hydroxylating)